MGQRWAGQGGCQMMGDMGFRRGMRQGIGHGATRHPADDGRAGPAYVRANLEITDAQLAAWNAYPTRDGEPARWKASTASMNESQRERERP